LIDDVNKPFAKALTHSRSARKPCLFAAQKQRKHLARKSPPERLFFILRRKIIWVVIGNFRAQGQ